jgi:hypothetical protein|tara:strand:+ start:1618 stop:1827 length:210 start_codon:yes stop_codon:yes gene_type:complete
MICTSINVALCISLSFLLSSVILGILYLVYMDNKVGEISLYLFAISFLICLIRTSIKEEEKNTTKVTPI